MRRARRFGGRKRAVTAALVAAALAVVALPAVTLIAAGQDNGTVDADGVWTHDTPADIGVRVSEATLGFAHSRPATLGLAHGSVHIPQADGITWGGPGDLPCGYGWVVTLPHGERLCFNEDNGTAAVENPQAADKALADQILRSAPAYKAIGKAP